MSRAPPSLNARRSEIGGHQGKRGEADRVVGARFSASQVGSLDGTWVLELTFPGIRDFPPLKKKKPRRDRGALLYKMNPTTPVTALSRPKSVCQNQFARSERRRHGFLPRTVCGRATNSLLFLPSFVVVAGLQTRAVLPFSLWGELPRPLFFSSPLSRSVIEATCFWRGTVRSTGPREVINLT